MKKNNKNNIILITLIVIILAATAITLLKNKKVSEERVAKVVESKEILKENYNGNISKENLVKTQEWSGVFEANKETKLSSEIPGKIEKINIELGDNIRKGQVICELNSTQLHLQKNSIEVQIEGFESDVKRNKILVSSEAIQKIQLEKSELALKAALSQKAIVEDQINKSKIKAPFDGVITHQFTEIGSFANPSMPLFQLSEVKKLKFIINIPESELTLFDKNVKYKIELDSYPDLNVVGKIIYIGSKSNMGNSFPIHFEIDNTKENIIKPGMFAKVKLSESKL